MAKTKKIKLTGVVSWAQVQEGNYDEYKGAKNWKICFYPNKDQIKYYKEEGGQVRLAYDDGEKSGVEGQRWQFKRPVEKDFNKGKGVEKLKPVKITLDGKDFDGSIGNGSTCEVVLEMYYTNSFGWGTRLEEVNIKDLIEYESPDKEDPEGEDEPPFETNKVENINIGSEPEKKGRKVDW